jgi:hypothetical protein
MLPVLQHAGARNYQQYTRPCEEWPNVSRPMSPEQLERKVISQDATIQALERRIARIEDGRKREDLEIRLDLLKGGKHEQEAVNQ